MQWYLLMLDSIRVPSLNITQSGFDQCSKCNPQPNCYTDSGDFQISLPLTTKQCNDMLNGNSKVLGRESLLLDILGVNGTTITLSLPLLWLAEQIKLGNVECTGPGGIFVLGFPIFQYYYVAYDMADNKVIFVDLQLSDETKAFIDGPEVNSLFPPSTGYRYHVPTKRSLMAATGVLLLAFQCIV